MSFDSIAEAHLATAAASWRPMIRGHRHVIAAGHYLGAQAGFQILEAGGNAADAGVAASIALCVVQSEYVNFAGVAPTMFRDAATGLVTVIDGLGTWPRRTSIELFENEYGGAIPDGILRTVIPAAPDAYITALERFGTMTFAEVSAPARRLAREGFTMYPLMSQLVTALSQDYARWPSNAEIYLPGGRPPAVGDLFVQQDLAATLEYMVAQERGSSRLEGLAAVRKAFYEGDIARAIVGYHAEHGGLVDAEDLAGFRCNVEASVTRRVMGVDIHTAGPWCQGPALIQMLRILEQFDLRAMGHNSADYAHVVLETMKKAFNDRERYYGDPRFVEVPLDDLLSEARAASHAAAIRMDAAEVDPDLGNVGKDAGPHVRSSHLDTSYAAVVDAAGNVFSVVPSDVSYDSPVIPGTGIVPSSRGAQSWVRRGHPSAVRAGARPRLTPSPVMVTDADHVMAIGTPGGDVQLQAVLQTLLNARLFDMDLQAAVEAPRFATYSMPDSFEPHEYNPGMALVENGLSAIVPTLEARGHTVHSWPDMTFRAGGVCAVALERSGGLRSAAGDPRRPSYALGW